MKRRGRRYGPGRIEETCYRADEVRYPEICAEASGVVMRVKVLEV